MSSLRLRIDKYLEGDESRPPKVFAKIYPLGESGARRTTASTAKQAMIPISHIPAHVTTIDLDPGRYYVEAVLPSGEVLADDVELSSDDQELVLQTDDSPHEWLSWQHLVGNVQSKAATAVRKLKTPKKRRGAPGRRSILPEVAPELAPELAPEAFTERPQFLGGEPAPEVHPIEPAEEELDYSIVYLSHPYAPLVNPLQGDQVWSWLASLPAADPTTLIHLLNENHSPIETPPVIKDDAHTVFRVSWSTSYQGNVEPLENRMSHAARYFAAVPRPQAVELVSLPIPWTVIMSGREADIEVVLQEPTDTTGFCTSAVARDEELGTLLGYLSSGALTTARQMAETAKAMLFEKVGNPFAAAAGAYALVGTALQATDREWHEWVRNLMNNFPHVPDGAIQWGQLRNRMRRSSEDIEEAKNAFKTAYKRGLPFYSMGMRWLLDGLEAVSHGDAEIEEMMKNVRRLAWRTHFQQPFTIIRLGGDKSV